MGPLHGQDNSCEQQRKRKHLCRSDVTSCSGHEPVFGSFTAPDILMALKQFAVNPFRLRKELEVNQILHVRKIMLATNDIVPPRKRKFLQLVKPNINEDSGMALKRNDQRKQKKVKDYIDISSPISCAHVLEMHTNEVLEDISRQKLRNRQTCNGVGHPSSEVPSLVKASSSDDIAVVIDWDSSIYKVPKQCHIPIGPHFQADIPEWTGSVKFDSYCNNVDKAGDLRWLGTRVWPMDHESTESILREIGKGRTENCSCLTPGSIECANQHVLEQRLKLQSELGLAFYSWRIDAMGEAVTKSWTTKEHKSFNSLVKKSMLPKRVNFWKHASKCFPGKSDEDLKHYYLNVFIPRRIGLQTRLSRKSIDTDDSEEGEDMNDTDAESTGVKKSRYLHGCR